MKKTCLTTNKLSMKTLKKWKLTNYALKKIRTDDALSHTTTAFFNPQIKSGGVLHNGQASSTSGNARAEELASSLRPTSTGAAIRAGAEAAPTYTRWLKNYMLLWHKFYRMAWVFRKIIKVFWQVSLLIWTWRHAKCNAVSQYYVLGSRLL